MKKILYFSAPWCGPCKQFAPVMEQIGQTVPVEKINVDEQSDLAATYGIRNVPTVLILKDGQVAQKFVGVQPPNLIFSFAPLLRLHSLQP
jgi:thioredoxin 1